MNKAKPHKIVERYFKKIAKPVDDWLGEECWLWTGALDINGYGQFGDLTGKTHRAHRLMAQVWCGPIPRTVVVRHLCDVPSCVNPAHLRLGSHQDNMNDLKGKKSRWAKPKLPETTIAALCDEDRTYAELMQTFGVSGTIISRYRRKRGMN